MLSCLSPRSRILAAALPLLFSVVLTLAPARRADAQAGIRLCISEVLHELDGTDRARHYIEIANFGTADWNPLNCWIYVYAEPPNAGPLPQLMVQIAGAGAAQLQPIKPGGVLLVEWARPNTTDNFPATLGPNVFATGKPSEIGDQQLRARMAIAVFAAQATAPPTADSDPTFGTATMLAYYLQGNINDGDGENAGLGARFGLPRAASLGLWEADRAAPSAYDWVTTLRWPAVAPGQPFPANIGRRASDYYLAHYGVPDLTNDTRGKSDAGVALPRYGSPGQPNLQFAGAGAELIPGQTLSNGYSLLFFQAAGTAATTAAGSPAAATHVAAIALNGAIGTNLLNATTWSGWQYAGGPTVIKPVFLDNPKTASRSLFVVDAFTNRIFVNRFVAVGTNPAAFQGYQAVGGVASSAPVGAVDATTGVETVAFNDATGVTMVFTGLNGTFAAAKPLPGSAKLADLTLVSTPSGFVVLGFTATGQLQRSMLAADGTPGALSNIGSAIANRIALAPVAKFNPVASQIEILQVGAAGALQLLHVKLGTGTAADTVSAAVNVGISTDAQPALAVNTDNGDLLVLARGASLPVPSGEKYAAQAGQARFAILRNAAATFLASGRVAAGLIPAGLGPDVFYSANTKQYVELLVGEDFQLYRNVAAS